MWVRFLLPLLMSWTSINKMASEVATDASIAELNTNILALITVMQAVDTKLARVLELGDNGGAAGSGIRTVSAV